MWTMLTFVAALALPVGQADKLTVTNVRSTYGIRGATRADAKFLPGDSLVLTYDIEGIKTDEAGKVLYSTATEVTDSKGKVLFKQDPTDLETVVALGGNQLPAYSQVAIGVHQPAGEYKIKVTITDRAAKKSTDLTYKFEVLDKAFGVVRLSTTNDQEGLSSSSVYGVGESTWVHFSVVGFERDATKKQPKVSVSLTVLDEDGKATLAKPFEGEISSNVDEKALSFPGHFLLSLNRAGKFTVELKATDKVSKKTTKVTIPLTVMPASK
jgi:hypothetical protein